MFEIYTLESEIHNNVALVLGVKTVFDLEAVFNIRKFNFKFLNKFVPVFSVNKERVKPKERRFFESCSPIFR